MQEVILNLLPVTEEEKGEFAAIAPRAEHIYTRGSAVTAEELARATVIFGWPQPECLAQAKSLRWFQTMWAGTDEYAGHIPAGAKFTSSSGSNQVSVAEHILASLLAVCRRLPVYRDSQRAHEWKDRGRMKCVRGSTVLVVGAGHIGSTFAAMCQGLGAHTLGLKRTVHGPVEGFDQVFPMERLDDLLPQADIVVLVVPHSPQTAGLMNEDRLRRMKEGAILISSGRGSVLDQAALAHVMGEGRLWGAALDVTTPEPLPQDSPLWDIPDLLITPHVAGNMSLGYTCDKDVEMFCEDLDNFAAGRPLLHLVDRKRGY